MHRSAAEKRKKPRIRNRPRNKSYRIPNELDSQKTDGLASSFVCDKSQDSIGQPLSAQSMPLNDAIKIIQKLLRNKILCKGEVKQTDSATPSCSIVDEHTNRVTIKCNTKEQLSTQSVSGLSPIRVKNAFMSQLQKKVEKVIRSKGVEITPPAVANTLYSNLEKLVNQAPVSDIESSDDGDEDSEYIEYVYKPRQYFLVSLCNLCKIDLCQQREWLPCTRCSLVYYCSKEHMKNDQQHRQLCYALRQMAESGAADNSLRALFYAEAYSTGI